MTATITRRPGRTPKAPTRPGLELLTDPDAPEPSWIDDVSAPDPGWVDEVLVARAMAGRYDLLDRSLTWAESVLVVGYVLDKIHESTVAGYRPERTMRALAEAMHWSGSTQAKLTAEARPKHHERMAEARANYKGWEQISMGCARKHAKGVSARNRVRRNFMGKSWKAA